MKPPPHHTYWILPGKLLGGPYPGAQDPEELPPRLLALLDFGISAFLDLTEPGEYEAAPYREFAETVARARSRKIEIRSHPIPDFSVADPAQMEAIIRDIDALLGGGHRVYLHCFAGVGRTALVGGCYLVGRGMAPEAALAVLNADEEAAAHESAFRPATEEQREMILGWPARAAGAGGGGGGAAPQGEHREGDATGG
jgi:hypothetical protein